MAAANGLLRELPVNVGGGGWNPTIATAVISIYFRRTTFLS